MNNRKILVAAAWPYANGSLHLGHASALIGADILARYFRLNGDSVLFVSGSDCHGTPIALEADRLGVKPAEIADKYHNEFYKTLIDGLSFSYDLYTKTTTENHYQVVQELFAKAYEAGHIYKKTEELPYCETCHRFLPDRYIEGECPICHFSSARGDQCDNCGNLTDTKQLINPKCKICGGAPVWKESEHFFLKLTNFEKQLKELVKNSKGWRINAKNFTAELLNSGLIDRAITRDTEWGIPIPLAGYDSKRIYVWFEAVCGYFSASKEWAQISGQPDAWQDFWANDEAIHYYVHGKDNIPFHTIIWPAILMATGISHLPDRIISSEYLTLEKKQFSKSRHWAVWLPDFLAKFNSETLRYYLVINGSETSDADFSWKEFAIRTNSELIGTFGNFAYRVLSFIDKNFPEGVSWPETLDESAKEFIKLAEETFPLAAAAIEAGRFREGLRIIFKLVEHGNRYINDNAPWLSIKTDKQKAEHALAVSAHVIKCLAILIGPFLPKSAEQLASETGQVFTALKWEYPQPALFKVITPKPLYKRVEDSEISEQESLLGA
jgi:methionyl-tRNA synthetase